jgi:serine/threonine protein phosphatase PrpC
MTSGIGLTVAALSDTGRVRKNNEDAAYVGFALYAVADGMGGHAAGEVASATVIGSLRHHDVEVPPCELVGALGQAVTDANADIASAAAQDPARRGMGTTLTAMLWSGDEFALANVGDSRAFRLRDGQLRQITEDHVMDKLVSNAGWFAPVLSRYLDGRADRSPDLSIRRACAGDRYLICSDGLSPVVGTAAIQTVLSSGATPKETVRQLVALAVDAGAPDNITVVIIDVQDAPHEQETARPVLLGSAATLSVPN